MVLSSFIFANDHHYPKGWDELQDNRDWKLIKELKRIKIYSKKISVSPLSAYRAEIISPLDMEALINTAWNLEKSVEIFPNAYIIDAGIYKQIDQMKYTAFQVFDIPFMAPRLYQFNSVWLGDSIHWVQTDTMNRSYNPKNMLLPPVNFGSWTVEKYSDQSKLTYRLCTDPGGRVPLWIVEQANQRYLPQMLVDLEKYATINLLK